MRKNIFVCLILICFLFVGCSAENFDTVYDEKLQLGIAHAVYIDANGDLRGFGDTSLGQLGEISDTYAENAKVIANDVKSVHAKGNTTAIIKNDNTLWICGEGCEKAGFVKLLDNVKSVDLGYIHSAAILTDGSLYVWGDNTYGQLGTGDNTSLTVPTKTADGFTAVSVSLGSTYALKKDGSLWVCGLNENGQLGNGNTQNINVFEKIADDVKSVYADFLTCGIIKKDKSLWIAGGENRNTNFVKKMDNAEKVRFGLGFIIVKKTDGSIWGEGNNVYGQLIEDSKTKIFSNFIKLSDKTEDFDCNAEGVLIKEKDGKIYVQGNFKTQVTKGEFTNLPVLTR